MTPPNDDSKPAKTYSRRDTAQLVMGVAALGLALGKTPAGAAEKSKCCKDMKDAEFATFNKLSASEQSLFLKLDQVEQSRFFKFKGDQKAERSKFLKVQSAD